MIDGLIVGGWDIRVLDELEILEISGVMDMWVFVGVLSGFLGERGREFKVIGSWRW